MKFVSYDKGILNFQTGAYRLQLYVHPEIHFNTSGKLKRVSVHFETSLLWQLKPNYWSFGFAFLGFGAGLEKRFNLV